MGIVELSVHPPLPSDRFLLLGALLQVALSLVMGASRRRDECFVPRQEGGFFFFLAIISFG